MECVLTGAFSSGLYFLDWILCSGHLSQMGDIMPLFSSSSLIPCRPFSEISIPAM